MPPPILWEPSEDFREAATLTRYMRWLERERGARFASYDELWEWSVTALEDFWASVWDFFGVRASRPYERVLSERRTPGARWFEGAELNYAEHIFGDKAADAVAVRHASELRPLAEMTWRELREMTASIAAALRARGVGPGDRVVAYMPNIPGALAAFLDSAARGAAV